eukprot:TRINITY_DN47951_c0_g1_i1.p1 TRINITY_DN47951_c0_g1~~TRINITY_DN47951_c0_g1_i1.p1  ORF type:complete len:335 (+),score=57.60 TRINITY_DN47951_c0_g1_i1:134-1006(+)
MKHDSWENALFVHWPVDREVIGALLPRGLEPDEFEGSAWVGLVLLTERGVSGHAALSRAMVKPIDHYGANVRTYVRHKGVPGIFFLSLECTSALASLGARMAGIPYFPARMWRTVDVERPLGVGGGKIGCFQQGSPPLPVGGKAGEANPQEANALAVSSASRRKDGPGTGGFAFEFSSLRVGGSASVTARWRLADDAAFAERDRFEERARFFVERYSVYAAWPWGRGPILLRGDVTHPPWKVQPAVLESLEAEPLFAAAGLKDVASGSAKPHVAFSRGVGPIEFWMLEPV